MDPYYMLIEHPAPLVKFKKKMVNTFLHIHLNVKTYRTISFYQLPCFKLKDKGWGLQQEVKAHFIL